MVLITDSGTSWLLTYYFLGLFSNGGKQNQMSLVPFFFLPLPLTHGHGHGHSHKCILSSMFILTDTLREMTVYPHLSEKDTVYACC